LQIRIAVEAARQLEVTLKESSPVFKKF
jgi:hypothetical protein